MGTATATSTSLSQALTSEMMTPREPQQHDLESSTCSSYHSFLVPYLESLIIVSTTELNPGLLPSRNGSRTSSPPRP